MGNSNTRLGVLKSSGSLLTVKIAQRSLGLISTLILARLLLPQDFGVVAIIAVALQFFDLMATAGSKQYIIQKKTIDSDDVNTAWTLDLCLRLTMFIALQLAAPYVALFYDNQDLETALRVAALVLPLGGFQNPGLTILQRNLEYHRLIVLSVTQKLVSFLVIVSLAVILRSYWAIVIGDIVGIIVLVIGSYLVHEFRPRPKLSKWKLQWGFSKWAMLRNIIGFMKSQVDLLFVSKVLSTQFTGQYYMGRYVASLPVSDLLIPVIEPLLAAFSKAQNDLETLRYQARVAVLGTLLIAVPLSALMFFGSEDLVSVVLGQNWMPAAIVLSGFSIGATFAALSTVLTTLTISMGNVRVAFWFDAFVLLGLALSLLSIQVVSLNSVVMAIVFVSVGSSLILAIYLDKTMRFGFYRVLQLAAIPSVASILACWGIDEFLLPQVSGSILRLVTLTVSYTVLTAIVFSIFGLISRSLPVEYHPIISSARDLVARLFASLRASFSNK